VARICVEEEFCSIIPHVPPNQSTALQPDAPLISLKGNEEVLTTFKDAADTFVKHTNDTVEIWAASRDWFLEEWGRDTFIALPGLLLAVKRYDEAKEVFRHFAEYEKNGIIPNRIQKDEILYNTVDGSLLFIYALKKYLDATGDREFVDSLLPTVRSIISHYQKGTSYERSGKTYDIGMDQEDGLILSPPQATWMDADPSGKGAMIVTPRNGKAVEINALWYFCLLTVGAWDHNQEWIELAGRVKESFNEKFWNGDEHCLFDVIDGDPHSAALRPNQLFAISHGFDLLSPEHQEQVLEAVTKDLLTPGGLRTLSPRDSHYRGSYDTSAPMYEKDWAYHQGTVWPWLSGPYCDALVIVRKNQGKRKGEIKAELEKILSPLVRFCLESEFKSLPEVFSGDSPHEPGGTTSQAWSIAEVLRVMVEYGIISPL